MLNRTIVSSETSHYDDIQQIVQSEKWFTQPLVVLVLGASGDLAKKKTYPALYDLWQQSLLPRQTVIWGFARTRWNTQQLRHHLRRSMAEHASIDRFLDLCFYRHGKDYGDKSAISSIFQSCTIIHNLLIYLAIPPQVFTDATLALKQVLSQNRISGFVRIVLEKPFGHDTISCRKLLDSLKEQEWKESELYRMDHYLGKEMVQNILMLRYNNPWLQHIWNKDVIQSVHILFKEPFGTEGRGGYFDSIGIVRDICQNHLLQILTLIAMQLPEQLTSAAIRDAKVKVLKSMPVLQPRDCLLGQYEGYSDDPTIADKDTRTPTYVCVRSFVNAPTWEGVPFVLEAGKALNERLCEARLFFRGNGTSALVLRLQPQPAIFLSTNMKRPGFSMSPIHTHMGIEYGEHCIVPEAYTRLLLDVLRGEQASFVRDDELVAAWELFTPLLKSIEMRSPIKYQPGMDGPHERENFLRSMEVGKPWSPPRASL
ncbi:hexose-6-phosphate dehydrogenase [Fistulifera solaris]|uniref:Glucose-6-phosphate 1-dehydrogenase n=1 Tax=Fistulifera solaris TaxID=1519565 RepID=A0A1Z5K1W1_FISSO|nr:hexose-6-phosphate dehydrogenase [Fistulifera solaris]|eukprot:GAX20257.1 hexose-6-phosphate dehydrogenase [Fistulifera solaris]